MGIRTYPPSLAHFEPHTSHHHLRSPFRKATLFEFVFSTPHLYENSLRGIADQESPPTESLTKMGSSNIQASLLTVLRRLFLWLLKGRPNPTRYISGYLRRLCIWLNTWRTKQKPPLGPSTSNSDDNTPKTTHTPYTIVKNGDTISLDGIAASLYPFSNGNIRNTSRSSVRSGHNPSVQSRNASRSSRGPGSLMSRRSAANSYYALPQPNSNPRTHPIPRRQWSSSMPHLQTETVPDRDGSIEIEVTSPISPGNHSQNSLDILPNSQPFSYEPNVETVGSPTHYDQTTFEVPPSPVSTNTHDLSRSNDHGALSYRSHARSHRSTSRLSGSSTEERYIRPTFPYETRRYTHRTKLYALRFFVRIGCMLMNRLIDRK